MSNAAQVHKGLEGVVVDTTSVSLVDGEAGRLYYRGQPIERLAQLPFTDVAHLVVFGELPDPERRVRFNEYLWDAGRLPKSVQQALAALVDLDAHPMAALQAVTPLLAIDPPAQGPGRTPQEEEALLIAARLPAAMASIYAATRGWDAPAYPQTRGYGARLLELMHGKPADPKLVEILECTQVLQLDHGFNASTFTARVVTSTLAPVSSAMSAALGALYGPLHGAADQGALEMAYEVASPDKAKAFVSECLRTGRRVLGMGHREYRVVDPRARIIKTMAEAGARTPEQSTLLQTLIAVEQAFVEQTSAKSRALRANMEFYKGVVYLSLGLPKEFFTAGFACARAFGWAAHIAEQHRDNRLIRPAALYVGPPPQDVARPG
jgi:citrate synthase